jgi:CyaY protein
MSALMMEEPIYQQLADKCFKRVEQAFENVDADDVDCERSGDVLTLTMKGSKRCVLNTQRPTRQMWLAANARAWHFSYDEGDATWRDDKTPKNELFSTIATIVKEATGIDVSF